LINYSLNYFQVPLAQVRSSKTLLASIYISRHRLVRLICKNNNQFFSQTAVQNTIRFWFHGCTTKPVHSSIWVIGETVTAKNVTICRIFPKIHPC